MNRAAIGIGYSLWVRLRWIALGVTGYLMALVLTVQFSEYGNYIALYGTLALSSVVAHLLTAFTLGPADLGMRGSGFPRTMFVLPARTRGLAGWAMAFGAGSIAILWIVVTACILRPAGWNTPILWPAALAASGTAWLQAIGWSPFPSPFARVPALAIAMTPLVLFGACAGLCFESNLVSLVIVGASVGWTFIAFLFAVQGLSRARTGSEGGWLFDTVAQKFARWDVRPLTRRRRPGPFSSPVAAHLWYECRRNAFVLPLMFGFIAVPMIVLIAHSIFEASVRQQFVFSIVNAPPSLIILAAFVMILILMCKLYGPGFGKFDLFGKDQIPAFFATRPMTSARFVFVKMAAAAISAAATCGVILLLVAVWAILESGTWNPRESVVRSALENATTRRAVVAIVTPLALWAICCREIFAGMWISLAGRKWLAVTLALLTLLLISAATDIRCYCAGWLGLQASRNTADAHQIDPGSGRRPGSYQMRHSHVDVSQSAGAATHISPGNAGLACRMGGSLPDCVSHRRSLHRADANRSRCRRTGDSTDTARSSAVGPQLQSAPIAASSRITTGSV